MHQQHICPQMPHKCHTCQLLHVQILDTYAINKVTEAMLSIHSTFLAYATEQHMLVTLHIYVPFYVYSSLQIGPTLLNTSLRNQWTATFICHTTAKYVLATNISFKCHVYTTWLTNSASIYGETMPQICHMTNVLNMYPWRSVQVIMPHIKLLTSMI